MRHNCAEFLLIIYALVKQYSSAFNLFLEINIVMVVRLHLIIKYSFLLWQLEKFPFLLFLSSIGFGFSDKPQPGYGFDYTLDGNFFVSINNGR